jgi:hypothetical protein
MKNELKNHSNIFLKLIYFCLIVIRSLYHYSYCSQVTVSGTRFYECPDFMFQYSETRKQLGMCTPEAVV